MNLVHSREPRSGPIKKVTMNADGIYLTFAKGPGGRPKLVARARGAMVYTSLYVPPELYTLVARQAAGVLYDPNNNKPTVESECTREPDNGRCPGCTKDTMDQSSCMDSCPLYNGE